MWPARSVSGPYEVNRNFGVVQLDDSSRDVGIVIDAFAEIEGAAAKDHKGILRKPKFLTDPGASRLAGNTRAKVGVQQALRKHE